jgi:hypothetical protein
MRAGQRERKLTKDKHPQFWQPGANRAASFRRSLSQRWPLAAAGFILAATCIAIVSTWASALPKISVSQSASLTDPFSIRFVVSNDGPLTIHAMKMTCVLMRVETSFHSQIQARDIPSETLTISRMEPGEKQAVPCAFRSLLELWGLPLSEPIADGEMTVAIEFRPDYVFWNVTRELSFATFRASDGSLYWKPEHWEIRSNLGQHHGEE